jgi:hypothetical protein
MYFGDPQAVAAQTWVGEASTANSTEFTNDSGNSAA